MAQNTNPYDQFVNVDYSSFSDWIFSFTGNEYAIISTIIAIAIASQLNLNQQNAIGNFFELLGQAILTINAQEINRRTRSNPNGVDDYQFHQDTYYKVNMLEQEIIRLRKEINELKK